MDSKDNKGHNKGHNLPVVSSQRTVDLVKEVYSFRFDDEDKSPQNFSSINFQRGVVGVAGVADWTGVTGITGVTGFTAVTEIPTSISKLDVQNDIINFFVIGNPSAQNLVIDERIINFLKYHQFFIYRNPNLHLMFTAMERICKREGKHACSDHLIIPLVLTEMEAIRRKWRIIVFLIVTYNKDTIAQIIRDCEKSVQSDTKNNKKGDKGDKGDKSVKGYKSDKSDKSNFSNVTANYHEMLQTELKSLIYYIKTAPAPVDEKKLPVDVITASKESHSHSPHNTTPKAFSITLLDILILLQVPNSVLVSICNLGNLSTFNLAYILKEIHSRKKNSKFEEMRYLYAFLHCNLSTLDNVFVNTLSLDEVVFTSCLKAIIFNKSYAS